MKTHQTHTPQIDRSDDDTASAESTETARQSIPATTTERMHSVNPVDQTIVGEVEVTPPQRVDAIIDRARECQRAWSRRSVARRTKKGRELFHELLSWREELIELLIDETGKNAVEARAELWQTCDEVGAMLAAAEDELDDEAQSRWWTPGQRTESSWKPRGVVLIVASGYDPLLSSVAPAIAALLAGNAVILVADERTPLVVQSVTNIATTIGIADRLWTGLVGGRRLIDGLGDRADAIVSYGSSTLTRRLARRQGDRMIPVMGRWPTQDVMVVLNDADIEKAARAAVCRSCGGAGRNRRNLRRIYVQESIKDRFVDAVVDELATLRQADAGAKEGLEIGPLFDQQDLHKLEELVDDASAQGARLVAGGRIRPRCRGLYFEPTILTGVDETMGLWQERAPGPIVAIASICAPAEAVRRTCDLDGYSSAAIYTANRRVARDLAERLEAPVVGINEVICHVPTGSPPIRTAFDGPLDPVGADRLKALSRRVLKVESRWSALPHILETRAPERMANTLDAAFSLVHRRGWVKKAIDRVLPGR